MLAALVVTASFLLRHLMVLGLGQEPPAFITFYPAVILVAILGGLGPGLVATALAVLAAELFIPPSSRHLAIAKTSDAVALVFFAAMGVFISLLAEQYRRSQRSIVALELERARRLAEDKVRQASEIKQLALDAAELGTWEFLPESGGVNVDANCRKLFGFRPDEDDVDAVLAEHIHPDDAGKVDEAVKAALAGVNGGLWGVEYRVVWPDGSIHRLKSHGRAYFDGQGEKRRATRLIGLSMDITELKQAEEKLRKSEIFYRGLFSLMNEGFCIIQMIFDSDGKPVDYLFLETNAAFERQTGLHEVAGKRMRELAPSIEEHWFETYGNVALTGEPVHFFNESIALGRHFEASAYRVGEPEKGQVAVVFGDITARVRAEEHIGRLNRVYAVLSDINQTIVREKDSQKMLEAACQIAVEKGQFRMAWVGMVNPATRLLESVASGGVVDGYLDKVRIDFGAPEFTTEAGVHFLQCGQHVVCNDIEHQLGQPWTEDALERGYRSSAALLLRCEGQCVGVLGLYASEIGFFDDEEMKLLDEMALDISFALEVSRGEAERKKAEDHVLQLSRVYSVLSDINQTIVREKDSRTMLEASCRIAVENGKFRMAWIGMIDPATGVLKPIASSGLVDGYLDELQIELQDTATSTGPAARCVQTGEHAICNDIERELFRPWRGDALRNGYRSLAAFPLRCDSQVVGVFCLYAGELSFFNGDELKLLDEMAMDISFALDVNRGEKERRKAEEGLRRRTAFFEAQVESALDGVLVIDSEGRKVLQNQRLNEMFRIPAQVYENPESEVQRKYVAALMKDPAKFEARIQHLNSHPEEVSRDEIELLDGTILDRYSAPVRDKLNNYYGRIWTFRDITEQRKLENNFRQAQKMEAIGQLTGGIAHDFNNLLTVIMGCSEVLGEELKGKPRLVKMAEMVLSAARQGAELTHRMLAFARRQKLEPRAVSVNHLLMEMETFLRRTLSAEIELDVIQGCVDCEAIVDPTQLESAILNLSVNARDAMPDGGVLTIETGNAVLDVDYATHNPDAMPGEYVLVAVSDTGTGISPENLGRVFDPFFTTKEAGKGTGLGLSMVYGFVKQSRGHIKIYSEPGHGTSVKLYLPRTDQQAEASKQTAASIDELRGSEVILLVEDNAHVREFAKTQLQDLGYQVLESGTGKNALQILEKETNIDLLFTDVVMPGGMNGRELAMEACKLAPGLKVLFTSGYADKAIAHQGLLDQDVQLLNKPYTRLELAGRIRSVLDAG